MNLGYRAEPIEKNRSRPVRITDPRHWPDSIGSLVEFERCSILTANWRIELTEVGHRYSLPGRCLSCLG
jgi:hypothetical protein